MLKDVMAQVKTNSSRVLLKAQARALCALAFALVAACLFAVNAVAPTSAFAADSITIPLTVENTVTGDTPDADETFTFVLEPETANAPMPSSDEVSITGSGSARFGDIDFTQAGQYYYTLFERAGTTAGYAYDTTTYRIFVDVSSQDGKLVTQVAAWKGNTESDATKVAALSFENAYSADGNGGNGGSGGSGGSDADQSSQAGSDPAEKLSKTGDGALALVPVIVIGIAFVALGLARRKRCAEKASKGRL